MKRSHGLLLFALLLQTGCSKPFDQPDIHIEKAAQIPGEAVWVTDRFCLPDNLTDVYYFSSRHMRCNYYVRGKLDRESLEEYETTVLKRAKELTEAPPIIYADDTTPIEDWWPASESQHLCIYELHNLDYVMIDRDAGIVYAALCQD